MRKITRFVFTKKVKKLQKIGNGNTVNGHKIANTSTWLC